MSDHDRSRDDERLASSDGPGGGRKGRVPPAWVRRILFAVLLVPVLLGVLAVIVSPSMAEHFLFFPDRRDVGAPPPLAGVEGRRVGVAASDGLETFGWYYPVDGAAGTVLLLHGNAASVADRTPLARGLIERDVSVFLLEYRGYGGAPGSPGIEGVIRDARAGLDLAARLTGGPDRLVLFGRSLGGAVGMQALDPDDPAVAAVILESSFTSLADIGQAVYPILPDFVFHRLRGVLDTRAAVGELASPLLVVHGTLDRIVPFRMGRELLEAASGPRSWYPVRGAGHNDVYLVGEDAYFDRLAAFVLRWTGG